jgi:hypothetical protein
MNPSFQNLFMNMLTCDRFGEHLLADFRHKTMKLISVGRSDEGQFLIWIGKFVEANARIGLD